MKDENMRHELIDGTLVHEKGRGIVARCICGWSSEHFSSLSASAAFMEHQEEVERQRERERSR